MKIACVGYLHGFGGAERQIITLANQLVERNHEVHMILLSDNKICYDLSSKVKIHSLLYAEKGNYFHRILRRRKALINILKELQCDIIVNFNFQSAYLLAFSSHKVLGKIIYSERGDPGDKEYKGLMGLIRSLALSHIDGFVFQSEGARNYFKNKHVRNCNVVIPNACFKSYEPYIGKRKKTIVNVGRLSKQKNQTLLIKAFALIADKYPDYNLDIYGDGRLKNNLEELIKTLNLQNRIYLKGTFTNISEIIRDSSLFVLSSDYEGIPNALIEALSLGLTCISTDCKPGGARTLINNEHNGIITPCGDIKELATAIDYCLSHPNESFEMGRNAMEISQILSPKNIYDKWDEYFNSLINK